MIITCDGPAASGKTTIARLVAEQLGWTFLSSGWFYRALAYLLLKYENYTLDTLINVSENHVLYYLDSEILRYTYDASVGAKLYFKGEDITPYLKDYLMDRGSILLSPVRMVRDAIMHLQRDFADQNNVVVEGRDCGSVVFPHADYKFYITADCSVRAARWNNDQKKRGNTFTQEEAEKLLTDRDERDKNRTYGALVIPDGAYVIDTGKWSREKSVDAIVQLVQTGNWDLSS